MRNHHQYQYPDKKLEKRMPIVHMCLTNETDSKDIWTYGEMKCQGISKNNEGHGSHRVPSRGSQFGICKVCGVSSFISASVLPGHERAVSL